MLSNLWLTIWATLRGVVFWINDILFEFTNPRYGSFYSLLPFMFIPLAFLILRLIIFYFKRIFN